MNTAALDPESAQDDSCDWCPPAWSLPCGSDGPFRVLVCEPRAGLRRQTAAAFRQAGLETTFAASIGEAETLARQGSFDAAVVDPEMEDRTGLALCARLGRGMFGKAMPVVSWCESRSLVLALRSRLAGASVHLRRPVSLDRFVHAVWDVAATHAEEQHRKSPTG